MGQRTGKRLALVAVSTAALVLTLAGPGYAAPGSRAPVSDDDQALTATALTPASIEHGGKSDSSAIARTPQTLLQRTDGARINVMIKFDYDAAASYDGDKAGLAATSPAVTGRKFNPKSAAVKAYTKHLIAEDSAITSRISKTVPGVTIRDTFHTVYGGVSAAMPANRVKDLVKVDGVVAVQLDERHQLLTDASPEFINAPPVYQRLGGTADAGSGIIYANLDSGVWPEHPSFADLGNLSAPPGPARACDFGDNPLTPEDDPFQCGNKLIGGQAFLDTYLANPDLAAAEPYHTARDSNGHGTHTASTSAGNIVEHAELYGVDRGPLHGIAPGAWIMEYKVCGIQGCYGSDSAAAVAQAIVDGADVINFSISGGTDPFTDPVELAFLDAYNAGVFVSTSAGNDGPTVGTANHLSPWVTTVAASTQSRAFVSTLTLTAGDGDTFTAEGASVTAGAGPLPIVMAASYGDALCQKKAEPGTFTGVIVACERGVNARVEKGYNVLAGGAAGMILFNPSLADVETDNHFLPAVHLADGTDFVAFMGSHDDVVGEFTAGQRSVGKGDVMAAFSSRGPAGLFLKPDVTAPGVEILAGQTPTPDEIAGGPAGQYFQAIAGTSMSSPHVAGAGILMAAAHPNWTPGQIKSALMTTSVTDVLKEDETTPADPFDMGAGRIDVGAAADVTLTLDETTERMADLGGDPLTAVDLNLPSLNAPIMPGTVTTTRTVTNVTGSTQNIVASATAGKGSTITVTPSHFTVRPGESKSVTITISSTAPDGEQQFGSIVFQPKKGAAMHLPVAFIHQQGSVSLSQECTPSTIAKKATSTCTITATNLAPTEQTVTMDTTLTNNLKVAGVQGAKQTGQRSVATAPATLAPSRPPVPAVAAGESPAGYLPLGAFGIAPTPVGDEDLVNFNVPAFTFAGEQYRTIGADSNGYIVVGGGTAADNNCCNLPGGPSAAAPNNVLAPFWTDLTGEGANGLYAGTLTDGVDSWVVVEWQVRDWETGVLRGFQVWIGTNGTEDITYTYAGTGPWSAPGTQPFLVGAENKLGEGAMSATLPAGGQDLRVTSSGGSAGGSASYIVTVLGNSPGLGSVRSQLTAPGVRGTTVVTSNVMVK
jgi:hypothetical protein